MKKTLLIILLAIVSPFAARAETAATAMDNELVALGVTGNDEAGRIAGATTSQMKSALQTAVTQFPGSPELLVQYVFETRSDFAALAPGAVEAAIHGLVTSPFRQFNTTEKMRSVATAAATVINSRCGAFIALDSMLGGIAEAATKAAPNPTAVAATMTSAVGEASGLSVSRTATIAGYALRSVPTADQASAVQAIMNALGGICKNANEQAVFAGQILKYAPLDCVPAVISALDLSSADKTAFARSVIDAAPSTARIVMKVLAGKITGSVPDFAASVASGITDAVRAQIASGAAEADPADAVTILRQLAAQSSPTTAARNALVAALVSGLDANPDRAREVVDAAVNGPAALMPQIDVVQSGLALAIAQGAMNQPKALTAALGVIADAMRQTTETDRENLAVEIVKKIKSSEAATAAAIEAFALCVGDDNAATMATHVAQNFPASTKIAIARGAAEASPAAAAQILTGVFSTLSGLNAAGADTARILIATAVVDAVSDNTTNASAVIGSALAEMTASSLVHARFATSLVRQTPALGAVIAAGVANGESAIQTRAYVVGQMIKAMPLASDLMIADIIAAAAPAGIADKVFFARGVVATASLAATAVARDMALGLGSDETRIAFAKAVSLRLANGEKVVAGVAQAMSDPSKIPALAVAAASSANSAKIAASIATAIPSCAAQTACALAAASKTVREKCAIVAAAAAVAPKCAADIARAVVSGSARPADKGDIAGAAAKSVVLNPALVRGIIDATAPSSPADRQTFTIHATRNASDAADVVTQRVGEIVVAGGGDLVAFTGAVVAGNAKAANLIAAGAARVLNAADRPAFARDVASSLASTLANAKASIAAGIARVSPDLAASVAGNVSATITTGIPAAMDVAKIAVAIAVAKVVPASAHAITAAVAANITVPVNLASLAGLVSGAIVRAFPNNTFWELSAIASEVARVARQRNPGDDELIVSIARAVVTVKPALAYDLVGAIAAEVNSRSVESAILASFAQKPIAGVPVGAITGAITAFQAGANMFQFGDITNHETSVTSL